MITRFFCYIDLDRCKIFYNFNFEKETGIIFPYEQQPTLISHFVKHLVLLLFLTISVNVFLQGQTRRFYFEISGNYSIIPGSVRQVEPVPLINVFTEYNQIPPKYSISQEFRHKPGFDISLGQKRRLTERLSLEAGLGITLVNYQVIAETQIIQNNTGFVNPVIFPFDTAGPFSTIYWGSIDQNSTTG